MRKITSRKRVVSEKLAKKIDSKLNSLTNSKTLMDERIMERILFEVPSSNGEKKWIRVRAGDVDHNGKDITAITYKSVPERSKITPNTPSHESKIEVEVQNYTEAIELLDKIGMRRASKQETKRTKYLCVFHAHRYIVTIDEWPLLADIRFIRVSSIEGAESERLAEFFEYLGVTKPEDNIPEDVDSVYRGRIGKPAREIAKLLFV